MIAFPRTPQEATALLGVGRHVRAGATDLQDRRKKGISAGDLVDLRDTVGIDSIEDLPGGGLRVGALVTLKTLAGDSRVLQGLAEAAAGIATPQIRARGTVGGNLLQQVRCWYYRNPDVDCLRKGGGACFARMGDHSAHSAIDQGPCIAPHPSTLAVALLAFGAEAEVLAADGTVTVRSVSALMGDGSNPTITHTLATQDLLLSVLLPPPESGTRSAWVRVRSRAHADWPLVEAVAVVGAQTVVALGGVANTPVLIRLEGSVQEAVKGLASPSPQTGYKVPLMIGAIRDAVDRAQASAPVPSPVLPEEVPE